MIYSKILPVPSSAPVILPGMAVPCGPHTAQAQPLTYDAAGRVTSAQLVVESQDPPTFEPRWGEARQLTLPEIVARHGAGIQQAIDQHVGLDGFVGVEAGPVFVRAEFASRGLREWALVLDEAGIEERALVDNNHEITGPLGEDAIAEPQRLWLDPETPAIPWDRTAPIGVLPLPGTLLLEIGGALFPYDSPYGAVGSGEGANPWGLVQGNRYLSQSEAVYQLHLRGTGALYENGGPISHLPAALMGYRLDGPSDPHRVHGWPASGDPLGWGQQDYSDCTHGVIDSQHMSRTLGLLLPAAYMGAEPWAINEIRCLAQTIVLCYIPEHRPRLGREDAWRMHVVATAVHLTPPDAPNGMRGRWQHWLHRMAVRSLTLLGPVDAQWGHHQLLPMYGIQQPQDHALAAPWESMLLISALAAAERVTPSPVDALETAADSLCAHLAWVFDACGAGRWPYKYVIDRERRVVQWILTHPDGRPNTDGDFYLGLLGLLWLPEQTGLDIRGTVGLRELTRCLEAWAQAQGRPLSQLVRQPPHSPAWANALPAMWALGVVDPVGT